MKLTQITVSYGQTQSLPEYSNVKPNLTLTAVLDEGDDPAAVEAELWRQAKAAVHEQIDLALESVGRAAKYDPAPRFQVVHTRQRSGYNYDRDLPELPHLVVILPNEIRTDKRFTHPYYSSESEGIRYQHALSIAAKYAQAKGATLIDCASGDLTPLWAAMPETEPDAMQEEDNRQ